MLHEEPLLARFEGVLFERSFKEGVNEPVTSRLEGRELQSPRLVYALGALFALPEECDYLCPKRNALCVGKVEPFICSRDCGFKYLLSDAGHGARFGVAAVVDMAFLQFADEGVAALSAPEHPAVAEAIVLRSLGSLAGAKRLHAVEELLADERLMNTLVDSSFLLVDYKPDIEGIVEHGSEAIFADAPALAVAKAHASKLDTQRIEAVGAGCVEFECSAHHRAGNRIDGLDLAAMAVVDVA